MRIASPVSVIAITVISVIAVLWLAVVSSPGSRDSGVARSDAVRVGWQEPVDARSDGCLAPMIAELQQRRGWLVRIDDMLWTDVHTDGDDDPKIAEIVIDAERATWQSMKMRTQTLPLTDAERDAVFAAFGLRCEYDASLPHSSWFEGRYIGVAYDRAGKAAATIKYNSPTTVRFGQLFESIRARYVASRLGAANSFVLKLRRHRRVKPELFDPNEYEPTDEDRVDFFDWLLTLPPTAPPDRDSATGTLTFDGTTRPIAVELHQHQGKIASALDIWMILGRDH